MDYLELPVWAKWSTRFPSATSVYGGLAAYAAYFIGGRYDFKTLTDSDTYDLESGRLTSGSSNDETVVRPFDYGAILVCGMEKKWSGEIRFSCAFVDSREFGEGDSAKGSLNSGFDFLVGYKF